MAVVDKNKFLGTAEKGGDLMVRPTTSLVGSTGSGKSEDVLYDIQTKLIKVDKLLKGTFAAKKSQYKVENKQKEDEKRAQQEADQEKPDKDGEEESPKSLIPKLSFLDGIKKFLGGVLMGWLTFRLIEFLPQIVSFLKPAAAFVDFLINFGGKLLDGLVTFVDKGYEVFEKTEEWIGDVFGEDSAAKFKNFAETFTKFLNVALIAAMIGAKGGMLGMGASKGVRRGVINTGKRIIKRAGRLFDPQRAKKLARLKNIKKIRADKLLRVKKFGRLRKFAKAKQLVGKGIDLGKNIVKSGKNIVKTATPVIKTATKTATKVAQTATKGIKTAAKTATTTATKVASTATKVASTATKTATTAAKTAAKTGTKLAKTGLKTGLKGLKALKKIVSPIVKKIPFIGALLDFVLNYFVFKEPLGKSAFMAIGAGVGAWLGGILGTLIPVPFVGTAIGAFVGGAGGDMLAGALYDAIFKEKKPKEDKKEEKNKTTTIKRNKEGYLSMLSSGEKGKIEQALYEMRINSVKTGEAHSDMVGNPKYAGDVDLIMKHGMQKVEIDRGRVKLQGNAENIIPLDVNSVAKKADDISTEASYEETGGETIIVKSGSEQDVDVETDSGEKGIPVVTGSSGGGGGSDEVGDALYKGG